MTHISNRCRKEKHSDCNGFLMGKAPPRKCKCESMRKVRVVHALDYGCRNFEGRNA